MSVLVELFCNKDLCHVSEHFYSILVHVSEQLLYAFDITAGSFILCHKKNQKKKQEEEHMFPVNPLGNTKHKYDTNHNT